MQAAEEPAAAGVGHQLAAARRERGMSVGDVSERTRIRASLVERIENEDFEACGGGVYARGHIRVIASTVGLDPGPLIELFDREHKVNTEPLKVTTRDYDPLPRASRRGGFPWVPAAIVSLAAICVIALIAIIIPSGSSGGSTVISATRSPGATPSAHRATTAPPARVAPTTPPPSGVNLRISVAKDPSWLSVRDSSQHLLLQQILSPGDVRTVTSPQSLTVKVGNAAAVVLTCNGKDLGFRGASGAVVTVDVGIGTAGVCQAAAPGASGGGASGGGTAALTPAGSAPSV